MTWVYIGVGLLIIILTVWLFLYVGTAHVYKAARAGQVDRLAKLLTKGRDPNERNSAGITALMMAAYGGHIEAMRVLLRAGADPGARTPDGDTALIWAARSSFLHNSADVVMELVKWGANVHQRNARGETPLLNTRHFGGGALNLLTALIRAGADVNATDNDGKSALMNAVSWRHTESVRVLLDAGANLHARDKDGWTALKYASLHKNEENKEIEQLLLDRGAK